MPYTPEAYAYTPVNYVGESRSIPALLLYEGGGLSYVRFRVQSSWPYYDGWSNWVTVGLFTEHVVTADPHEPAVADLLGELKREKAAAHQQHLSNCGRQANGQGAVGPIEPIKPASKSAIADSPSSSSPSAPVNKEGSQNGGSKERAPTRGRRARANAQDARPLKPIRSIAGLTIADFLYDR